MEDHSELKFPAFPFKPYSIQIDFMNALYQSLDRGGISMLESPTGTGKTLSIICSALQWLIDRKQKQNSEATTDSNRNGASGDQFGSDDEPDWMRNFVVNIDNQVEEDKKIKNKKKKQGLRSVKADKKRNAETLGHVFNHRGEDEEICKGKDQKNVKKKVDAEELYDEDFLVEEYESEEECEFGNGQSKRKAGGLSVCSSSGDEDEDDCSDDEDEEEAL